MAIATTKRKPASSKTTTKATTRKPAAPKAAKTGVAASRAAALPPDPVTDAAATPASAPAPNAPVPTVVSITTPDGTSQEMKKKELIDRVVKRSGIKKKDAKPVVEAMLGVLGESIADGRELNLPPLGKLRINRSEEKGNGRVIICKLRQPRPRGPASADDEALAEPDADS